MFELSLLDHLRLTFGHVVSRQHVHTRLASSRVRWSQRLRAGEAVSIAGVAVLAACAALGRGRAYEISCAVLATGSLIMLILHLTLDLDGAARAHATCATRLWHIRERYRALLTDLADGALGVDAVRMRRDDLMDEVHRIYEQAPAVDQQAYLQAGRGIATSEEGVLTDADIDLLLPKVFHKAWKSAA